MPPFFELLSYSYGNYYKWDSLAYLFISSADWLTWPSTALNCENPIFKLCYALDYSIFPLEQELSYDHNYKTNQLRTSCNETTYGICSCEITIMEKLCGRRSHQMCLFDAGPFVCRFYNIIKNCIPWFPFYATLYGLPLYLTRCFFGKWKEFFCWHVFLTTITA